MITDGGLNMDKFDVGLFGERFAELKASRKINVMKLAEALGVNHATVSRWESGKLRPSIDSFFQIVQFFGVHPGYLLGTHDVVK